MLKKILITLVFIISIGFVFVFSNKSFAATEFVSTIQESGGDYNTLNSWNTAVVTNSDLTVSSTKVYSASSTTGTVADNSTITGSISSSTKALVAHVSTSSNQVFVRNIRNTITGTSTFSTSSNIVTGSGTLYTTEATTSDYIWLESSQTWQQILSIQSSTQLTLSATSTISGAGQTSVRGKQGFQSSEQLRVDASNYVVISNIGDSAILTAKIDGAWTSAETSTVAIQNATTSATNYIRIYTTSAARHTGKWDSSKYRIEVSSGSGLTVSPNFTRIMGLQIALTASNIYTDGISANSSDLIAAYNVIKGPSALTTYEYGISSAAGNNFKIYNNIIYDFKRAAGGSGGISIDPEFGQLAYIYNNTIYNCYTGVHVLNYPARVIVKNVLVNGCTDGFTAGLNANSDYNLSDLASDAPGANSKNSTTVSFVSTSTPDFHLASTDTSAKDSATSTVSEIGFTDDIDGQTRPYGSAWDIGADENYTPSNPSSFGPSSLVNGSWSTSTQPQFTFNQPDANASNTQQYKIQISTSSSFASQTVDYTSALLSQTSTSFTVGQASSSGTYTIGTSSQTLSDGQYYWRVMSTDNLGATSSYATANSGSVAFGVDTTAPTGTIASSTYGTITSSSIIINRPSTSTITESGSGLYQWQVRKNSTTTLSAVSTSTASTSDSSLTSNTQYTYDVRFIDVAGNISSYGASSSKYTLTPTPTNLSITPSQTSNALLVDSFNNASSSSSGYYFSNTTNSNNSGWITTNSWTDTGLTCNTSYTYTIKYRNGDATESATSSLSQTTSACTVSSAVASAGLPISILASAKPKLISTNPSTGSGQAISIPISTNINQYPSVSFSRHLYPGLSNPEVKNLQTLLSNYSDIYPEAKITGYFGPLTKQAVQRFQIKYNITNKSDKAFGLVGPKTRKVLNLLEQINYLQNQLNQLLSQIKKPY